MIITKTLSYSHEKNQMRAIMANQNEFVGGLSLFILYFERRKRIDDVRHDLEMTN